MKMKFSKIQRYSFMQMLYTFALGIAPFMLLCGILGAFGFGTVQINDEPVHGIKAFLVCILLIPLFAIVFSSLFWLATAVGILIHNALFSKKNEGEDLSPKQ